MRTFLFTYYHVYLQKLFFRKIRLFGAAGIFGYLLGTACADYHRRDLFVREYPRQRHLRKGLSPCLSNAVQLPEL